VGRFELVHTAIADPDFARVERLETREHAKERRLPAAGRPEEHETLTRFDVEADAIGGMVRAEPFRHALEADSHQQAQYTPRL
jgi:hypothetical protein